MPRFGVTSLVTLTALAIAASIDAQPASQPAAAPVKVAPPTATFAVTRSASAIKIDGALDEPAWAKATVVPLLYEWAPGDNVPPPVATECLVTYDDRFFYVAFRAHDPKPQDIRAPLMDRDDTDTLIQGDHVGVMIDTFNDERRAFQFRINPRGVQADAIFSEQDGIEDFSWDMVWNARARITDDGYVVEIAFPLKQLRFPGGGKAQTWGFEAFRSWPRNVRHRITSAYRDRSKLCILCQENKLTGLEGMLPGRNIELDPTLTSSRTDRVDADGASLRGGTIDASPGISGRWSVTSNLTLNGAVNPDFSQVEADVAQLDVNTRFALYYPEKRPFFLEGLDYFSTPIQTVFTRTVADPYGGVKLTGKQGANAIGVFATVDRLNNLLIPANEGSSDASLREDTTAAVLRYRRDIGAGSTFGVLYSGREARDYHNRQYGLDAFLRVTKSDSVRVEALRTDTKYPQQIASDFGQSSRSFSGDALFVDYQHASRTWIGYASFESYSPGFRSDSGFVPRVDYRNIYGQVQRRFWGSDKAWFTTLDLGVRGWNSSRSDWTLTDRTFAAFVNYSGPLQSQFIFNGAHDLVVFNGVTYNYWRPNVQAGIKPSGNTNVTMTGRFGDGVDFANSRKATEALQIGPSVEYRPVTAMSLGLSHNFDQLSVPGGRLYRANLTQARIVYNLSVRSFIRAIVQYTDITRNTALYTYETNAHSRRLFTQFLFSYKLNPQTVVFAGYSDNYSGGDAPAADLRRQNRTFFVKLGYAWMF
jgi:hypothetical protein